MNTTQITSLNGDGVRARRIAAGLSQLELAERARCSPSTVRLFDRGYTPGHSEALERVLVALDELERESGGRFVPFPEVRGHLDMGRHKKNLWVRGTRAPDAAGEPSHAC